MKTTLIKRQGTAEVALKGAMDESTPAELEPLLKKLAKTHVLFDASALASVNSLGFRAWLRFLKQLDSGSTFNFLRCPPCYVDFCNLLPSLSFAAKVTSVLVPYRCETCRAPAHFEVKVEHRVPEAAFEPLMCGECNGVLTAEAEPASYLEFLRATA